ncbi:MAG: hypothetical protein MI924_04205 [Chloroflexales bacterium]|nr:hypothetical protein [Chloroflexales bacterium]
MRELGAKVGVRIVITSRILPYQAPGDWKLLPDDGWRQRTIQPLAFGQVRVFVRTWYQALAPHDPDLARAAAAERAAALLDELAATERLRPLLRSPLLLTMLAILHSNTGDVPRDRAKLYEECVQLLLERWEPERQPGMPRQGLRERLDLPSLDSLRQVLHELAYQAHAQPPGADGRGVIADAALDGRMLQLFERSGPAATAYAKLQVFREVLGNDEARLLQDRGDDSFAFPHLTLQEYFAAGHLAGQKAMAKLADDHWQSDDRERWREVVVVLMGRLHQQDKAEEKALPWLKRLWGTKQSKNAVKPAAVRRRDVVLAALSYAELTARGAFDANGGRGRAPAAGGDHSADRDARPSHRPGGPDRRRAGSGRVGRPALPSRNGTVASRTVPT